METYFYPCAALERAMKIQEVILRAMDGRLKWYQAAEILGISDRQMRRWRLRYERWGYDGLMDSRCKRPSPRRVKVEVVKEVLRLYRERYFDFNVFHFHQKLVEEHGIELSYTWVKNLLQTAGLVAKAKRKAPHRKSRPRRPLRGMLLFVDASTHSWIPTLDGMQDLIVVLDDATTEVYYACLVPQESTQSTMEALKAVVEAQGLFCALYTDRASHFMTSRGGRHNPYGPTQIQRALGELGIELIRSHSPQARGRMERLWGTWQGRLPMELRVKGLCSWEAANELLATTWVPFHNKTWTVAPESPQSAFVPLNGQDLNRVFSIHHSRVVGNDNCVQFARLKLQIPPCQWRYSFAKCQVKVYQHLDGTISIGYGPHPLGRYDSQGRLLYPSQAAA